MHEHIQYACTCTRTPTNKTHKHTQARFQQQLHQQQHQQEQQQQQASSKPLSDTQLKALEDRQLQHETSKKAADLHLAALENGLQHQLQENNRQLAALEQQLAAQEGDSGKVAELEKRLATQESRHQGDRSGDADEGVMEREGLQAAAATIEVLGWGRCDEQHR